MKIAYEASTNVIYYFRPVKKIHKGFLLATLENSMKMWPGLSHFVMKITPIILGGIPRMTIGYHCNNKKLLGFIDT